MIQLGDIKIVLDGDRIRLTLDTVNTSTLDQLEAEGSTISEALLLLHEEVEFWEGN